MINEYDIEYMADYHYKLKTIQKIFKTRRKFNYRKYNQILDYLDL